MDLESLRASHLMSRDVITVPQHAPLREAAAILYENGITGAPVVDEDGQVVGVLSASDIVYHEAAGDDGEPPRRGTCFYGQLSIKQASDVLGKRGWHRDESGDALVADVMTARLITVPENAGLVEVADTMFSEAVHRVLVTDVEGYIVGIVGTMDILRVLSGRETEPSE